MFGSLINPIVHAIKFKRIVKSAEDGDATLQYKLGVMYHNGSYVTQDYEKALFWYTKAAEQGYPPAQANLGEMYEYGYGVSPDDTEAS
ncbi:tetratricopeptide repeat protein, partial [Sulfuricurvum sp. RIFOXYD2_FULL_44_160]